MIRTAALFLILMASQSLAQNLTLPSGARLVSDRTSELDSYELPIGPFVDGAVPAREVEGKVERLTWRLQSGSSTTLQLLAPLRDQVAAQGYEILLECQAKTCGGFDFRFGTEVVPTPDMYVAIQDYRFISAIRDGNVVSLLVSRTPPDGYVQMIRVIPVGAEAPPPLVIDEPVTSSSDLLAELEQNGHVILEDLHFRTGEMTLGEGPFASLKLVAEFLNKNPSTRLALVGHTDDTGALDANISVSTGRAQAVRARLIEAHGIAADRVEARGIGYLAPLTSNTTSEGRNLNRRVEAVLLIN